MIKWGWWLIDQIRRGAPIRDVDSNNLFQRLPNDKAELMRIPRFDISNVAEMLLRGKDFAQFRVKLSDLPRLNVPFSDFWMEWRLPFEKDEVIGGNRVTFDPEPVGGLTTLTVSFFCGRIGWLESPGTEVLGAQPIYIPLEPNGQICRPRDYTVAGEKRPDIAGFNYAFALYALGLMNCRNSTVTSVRPPRHIEQRLQRRNSAACVRYNIITVRPIGKSGDNNSMEHKGEAQRATYICRGHFKTYTSEKRLFGTHEGTWWWSDHARCGGSEEIIISDYSVKGFLPN